MSFQRINEAIEFFKDNCSYVAVIGAVHSSCIPEGYVRESVEEQSFNHIYAPKNGGHCFAEDCWSGQSFIPLDDKEEYLLMEWSS